MSNSISNEQGNSHDPEVRPPSWKVWVLASRPHTLTASLAPVLTGHHLTVATVEGQSPGVITWQWLFFCMCIQLGTNLHNDYADFVKGADTHKRVGQARATQKGWLTPGQTAAGSMACLALALAIGVNLIPPGDSVMWFIVISSIFNAVAYTGGPFPLGYIGLSHLSIAYAGLGDIFCFLYFGLVATLTVPYLHVRLMSHATNHATLSLGEIFWNGPLQSCWYTALPVGCLATAIIVVNNLRDRHTDLEAHKRTVAVRFGGTFCKVEYALLILGSYGMAVGIYLVQHSVWSLLPLLSLPLAIPQLQAVSLGGKDGAALNSHVGGTARLQLVFCLLWCLGLRLRTSR